MSALLASPRVLSTALVAAAIALTASTAAAADQTKFDLFKQVQDQVLRYSFFTVFDDINIAIEDDGTVTLTGSVTGDHKKSDIEKRVAKLDGVTHVNNEITLLPALEARRPATLSGGASHLHKPALLARWCQREPTDPHRRQSRACHAHGCRRERG